MRLLVEGVKDYAIYMLDPDGKIATWNHGAQIVTGYRSEEVVGRSFSMFFAPEAIADGQPERVLQIAAAEGRYHEEGFRIRKAGEQLWAEIVLTPIRDPRTNALRGFATILRDLTERRRIEQQAQAAAEEARNQRARAIEAANAVRLRDEFISVAAHELRTPLTALRLKVEGLMQALRRTDSTPQTPKHVERLAGALRQVTRLGDLVERLLDVSRIVQGRLHLDPEQADLAALTLQVVDDFRESAREAGSELEVEVVGKVTGVWDRARLEQVIVNLVSNAIKYGAGKPIGVRVEATETSARLTVVDHGIGIAAEHLDRIFARFERAVPITHYGGLGLGLYLCRNIVEAHGGAIRVSSSPGRGSTFVVDLPPQVGADRAKLERAESGA
jgi:PAS domain S-box-containing protein